MVASISTDPLKMGKVPENAKLLQWNPEHEAFSSFGARTKKTTVDSVQMAPQCPNFSVLEPWSLSFYS